MSEQDAIEILRYLTPEDSTTCTSDAISMAIKALETVQKIPWIIDKIQKEYDNTNWGKPYGISLDKVIEIIKTECELN